LLNLVNASGYGILETSPGRRRAGTRTPGWKTRWTGRLENLPYKKTPLGVPAGFVKTKLK